MHAACHHPTLSRGLSVGFTRLITLLRASGACCYSEVAGFLFEALPQGCVLDVSSACSEEEDPAEQEVAEDPACAGCTSQHRQSVRSSQGQQHIKAHGGPPAVVVVECAETGYFRDVRSGCFQLAPMWLRSLLLRLHASLLRTCRQHFKALSLIQSRVRALVQVMGNSEATKSCTCCLTGRSFMFGVTRSTYSSCTLLYSRSLAPSCLFCADAVRLLATLCQLLSKLIDSICFPAPQIKTGNLLPGGL